MIALGKTENGLTIAVLETHELNILHAIIPMLTASAASQGRRRARRVKAAGERSESRPPRADRSKASPPGFSQPEHALDKMRRAMAAANRPFTASELSKTLRIPPATISAAFAHNPAVFERRSYGVYSLASSSPASAPSAQAKQAPRAQAKQARLAAIRASAERVLSEPDPLDRAAALASQIRAEEGRT
jgi:hypothetical protein